MRLCIGPDSRDKQGLFFIGNFCIDLRLVPQPILEEDLLSGSLEPTNLASAVAKIAGIEMGYAFNCR